MRLLSLELRGIRGFARTERFDLDADAVVVVGANGTGKTSLFDGILWALTGRVQRLGDESGGVLSKFSPSGDARACLTLRRSENNERVSIVRVFDGESTHVSVEAGGKVLKGPSAEGKIIELLWQDAASAADSQASLASVITSSVYLQQDLVRQFIDPASEQDRFATVSELVGAGRVTDLQGQLERAKVAWTKTTNQQREALRQTKEKLSGLEAQLNEILTRRSRAQPELSESQWLEWWKQLDRFGLGLGSVLFTSKDASSRLDAAMRQLGNLDRTTERRLQLLSALQSDIAAVMARLPVDLAPHRERVTALQGQLAEQRRLVQAEQARMAELRRMQVGLQEAAKELRTFAEMALKRLGDRCPVCDQDYDREATERRLRAIIGNQDAGGKAPVATEILPDLLKGLARIEKDLSSAQLGLRGEEQKVKDVQLLEQGIARRFEELALDANAGTDRAAVVQEAIRAANDVIRSSAEQRRTGEALALQLTQASDQARIEELRNEVALLTGSVEEQDGRVKERTVTGGLGQRMVEALREATSTVVTRRLEELAPLLQGIYSRIDPHPAFRVVSFLSEVVRGRGRLYTVIRDPQSSAESNAPNTVLSSSQMNALAVSVFLSLNLGVSRPPLYSAILDDPLQSLDDINLLGLVDLLRRTKDHRQLLVSTHNERFGALLARKLRPTGPERRTVLIELKGWAREGPVVKHRDVKCDPSPIRLAAS